MAFDERTGPAGASHHIMLEDRRLLSISGVEEVESFDETTIVLRCAMGDLIIRGVQLHIEKLSLDGGELRVEGTVDSLTYEDAPHESGGLFARLFR